MKKHWFITIVLMLFFITLHTDVKADENSHCQAGFDSCMTAQQLDPEGCIATDCIRGWLACIGYDGEFPPSC